MPKNNIKAMTLIEIFIGVVLLGITISGIMTAFLFVQRNIKDGIALSNCQTAARNVSEEITRVVRDGESITVPAGGNSLIVGTDVFTFDNGDGNDATWEDNSIKKNGAIIGEGITKSGEGMDIFTGLNIDGDGSGIIDTVELQFGVQREGRMGIYQEVVITARVSIRN